jgi:hypothetical protein
VPKSRRERTCQFVDGLPYTAVNIRPRTVLLTAPARNCIMSPSLRYSRITATVTVTVNVNRIVWGLLSNTQTELPSMVDSCLLSLMALPIPSHVHTKFYGVPSRLAAPPINGAPKRNVALLVCSASRLGDASNQRWSRRISSCLHVTIQRSMSPFNAGSFHHGMSSQSPLLCPMRILAHVGSHYAGRPHACSPDSALVL